MDASDAQKLCGLEAENADAQSRTAGVRINARLQPQAAHLCMACGKHISGPRCVAACGHQALALRRANSDSALITDVGAGVRLTDVCRQPWRDAARRVL